DMGREIVHMESTRGKRSRLFKPQEVSVVVQGNKIPFDEGFFSAPALSIPSRKYPEYEGLQIDVQSNEILD
ncbi:hypothetical protein MTR67_040297, partial [Solanum verrucosum]